MNDDLNNIDLNLDLRLGPVEIHSMDGRYIFDGGGEINFERDWMIDKKMAKEMDTGEFRIIDMSIKAMGGRPRMDGADGTEVVEVRIDMLMTRKTAAMIISKAESLAIQPIGEDYKDEIESIWARIDQMDIDKEVKDE